MGSERYPWYKSAIFYEVSLKAFKDSTNGGIGDFKGLIEKLDYLNDLGITCIWILPFYPSPWLDDGFDVTEYRDIHPIFGSMEDFELLISEAHKRNIRVIGDFVINHTSDQHLWFEEARKSKNSPKRQYYVWSDSDKKYQNVRIIFKDTESSNWTLDPSTNEYYWHRFYSHQPDLNYESPEVQEKILEVVEFWLDKGMDGLRVDAVPYLYEEEGTSCESLPKTHEYIKRIRSFIDEKYGKNTKILLAEANQMLKETLSYFGEGTDEFHMAFSFPLMPRLFLALATKDVTPIISIIRETLSTPDECQWCTFLRNHDELTLEMVEDEVRNFMWDFYAPEPRMRLNLGIRRRLAPLLDNKRDKIEFMNSLLFSLPGSPIIYYGDEIGMGDNIDLDDRNGLRTPMQWSDSKNAGFSEALTEQLFLPVINNEKYGCKNVNVEKQSKDPKSLLSFFKKLIKIRKSLISLQIGNIEFLETNDRGILAFTRKSDKEIVLIIYNFHQEQRTCIIKHRDLEGFEMELCFPWEDEKPFSLSKPIHIEMKPLEYLWYKVRPEG
jgi:maltose alpha-D-glucosyltransferase/alpha-amylase